MLNVGKLKGHRACSGKQKTGNFNTNRHKASDIYVNDDASFGGVFIQVICLTTNVLISKK